MTVAVAPPAAGLRSAGAGMPVAAGGVVLLLGAAVPVAAGRASTAGALVGAVTVAALCSLGAGRVLLAVVVVSLPFQLGTTLAYREDAASVGSLGGFEVSVTTAAVAGLCALRLVELTVVQHGPRPHLRGTAPFATFVGLVVASTLFAADVGLALFEVALLVEMLLLLVVLLAWMRHRTERGFVLGCFLAAGAAQAVLVVVGRVLPSLQVGRVDTFDAVGARSGGTLGSPNTAGGFFAALLVLSLAVALSPRPSGMARGAAATVPLAGGALLLTSSRGAWAGGAVGVGLVVAVLAARGWVDAGRAAIGVALLLLAVVVASGPVGDRLTGDDGGATAGRQALVHMTSDIIAAHPLTGVGPNNIGPVLLDHPTARDDDTWVYAVHNKFLLVFAEAGLLALTAFVWFLVAALRAAIAAARSLDAGVAALAVGAGGALVALIVQMLVEPFSSRPQMHLVVLLFALAHAAATATTPREVAGARS